MDLETSLDMLSLKAQKEKKCRACLWELRIRRWNGEPDTSNFLIVWSKSNDRLMEYYVIDHDCVLLFKNNSCGPAFFKRQTYTENGLRWMSYIIRQTFSCLRERRRCALNKRLTESFTEWKVCVDLLKKLPTLISCIQLDIMKRRYACMFVAGPFGLTKSG